MSTTDPLDALRAAISAKYEINPVTASGAPAGTLRAATHLRLSASTTVPKSAPTRLRKAGSSATDPSAQPDGFFMLEAVYLAWSLRDTPGGEYMRQAREHGLPAGGFVSLTERKSIVDWLRRAISTLDSIVPLSGACIVATAKPKLNKPTKKKRVDYAPWNTAPLCSPPSACPIGFCCTCADVDTGVRSHTWRRSDVVVAF